MRIPQSSSFYLTARISSKGLPAFCRASAPSYRHQQLRLSQSTGWHAWCWRSSLRRILRWQHRINRLNTAGKNQSAHFLIELTYDRTHVIRTDWFSRSAADKTTLQESCGSRLCSSAWGSHHSFLPVSIFWYALSDTEKICGGASMRFLPL